MWSYSEKPDRFVLNEINKPDISCNLFPIAGNSSTKVLKP